ncbi:MAG: hypothetical protein IH921_03350 [Gemmatimonadetes bacterium]|nr:hypothetical protein [Gemmatimonadota bacterium]
MAAALTRRRQVVLFLVAVVLPSAVLVVLGIRLISQQGEIQRSRLADDRRAALSEASRLAIAELEDVEARILAALDESLSLPSRDYPHPAVRFVARVEDGRVILPWEENPSVVEARRALADPDFARRLRNGQRAELGGGDRASASQTYRDAIRDSRSETQRAFARMLLARSLAGLPIGGTEVAEQAYVELLATPGSVVDEYGVPFALYAAARLREWEAASEEVTRLLQSEVELGDWRSPTALYLLRDLLSSDGGTPPALDEERIELESALAVQRDYSLLVTSGSPPDGNGQAAPGWLGIGPGDWLAKVIGPAGAEPTAVVAVSFDAMADAIAGRVNDDQVLRASTIGALEIGLETVAEGTPLGVARPDFAATFLEPPQTALGRILGLRNAFFSVALLLVLSVTLFGGYLLLHGVKREMRVAELQSDFVSSVSHELKTPLTAIRMFAETLRSKAAPDPAMTAEYLDTIVGESERLTRLLDNVLDLSQIEQGQRIYSREPTSLAEIAARAARAVEYPLSSEGFRLDLDLDDGLPPVSVDRDSVEQAVLNLLTNAMKYSGTSREIGLSLRRQNGHAVIAVSDRGVGIPLEAQSRLTEKFYRVRSPENEHVPGTGLGLTIVEHTARAHGGHLTLESAVGEGSTFSIHLPMEDQP